MAEIEKPDTPTNVVDNVVKNKGTINQLNEAIEKFINEDIIPFTSGDFQKMIGVKSLKDVDGNIVPWTSYFDDLIDDSAVNEFLLFLQTAGDVSLSERDTKQIGRFLYDAKTNPDALKGFALDKNKVDNVGHLVWSTIQTKLPSLRSSFYDLGSPDELRIFGKNLAKYFNISDTPTNVVDDLTELENSIRTKYSDYLEKDTIRGYEADPKNPFERDMSKPMYEKRGLQLDYFQGDPSKNFPYNKDTLFIKYLYIDETQRGQGIGSQIFDEIKQFADDNGLYIRLKNDQNFNTSFWEKKGFGIYEGDKSADYSFARLDDYVLAPKGETLPVTPNRLDTPTNVVGEEVIDEIKGITDNWVDNLGKTTTSFIDNLPLSTTVKNQFNNLVKGRARNLATPGGVADAVDVWELGVLGLMIAAVAYKEYDEIPTILTNKAIDMFNNMTSFYNIPPVPKEEYNLDYEFINKVVETGEKFMPTDIIIKKVGEVVKGAAETGTVTGFGYVPTTTEKADTMEKTQRIQPGVQENKIFEQAKKKENIKKSMKTQYQSQVPKQAGSFEEAILKSKEKTKPKKSKSGGGGSGVKIL